MKSAPNVKIPNVRTVLTGLMLTAVLVYSAKKEDSTVSTEPVRSQSGTTPNPPLQHETIESTRASLAVAAEGIATVPQMSDFPPNPGLNSLESGNNKAGAESSPDSAGQAGYAPDSGEAEANPYSENGMQSALSQILEEEASLATRDATPAELFAARKERKFNSYLAAVASDTSVVNIPSGSEVSKAESEKRSQKNPYTELKEKLAAEENPLPRRDLSIYLSSVKQLGR